MLKRNKVCLVLGANGFVGSHLVDELVDDGYKVKALDLFREEPKFKLSTLIEIYKGNIYDVDAWSHLLEGVDYVFHSFSATTPFSTENDPYTDIEKNLVPSLKIFELCSAAKVKKLIYLSSGGAIYGHIAEERSATEEDATVPVSPYGIVKLTIENYLAYFNRKHDMKYVVYRLTNPYGPRQAFRNNQGVIPAFLGKVFNNEEVTVLGDGDSTRDFIYIKDATHMITSSFVSAPHNTYNIGSGVQTSVNQIIATIEELIHRKVKVKHIQEPRTFLKHAKISTKRYTQDFGPAKTINLSEGLQRVLIEQKKL